MPVTVNLAIFVPSGAVDVELVPGATVQETAAGALKTIIPDPPAAPDPLSPAPPPPPPPVPFCPAVPFPP